MYAYIYSETENYVVLVQIKTKELVKKERAIKMRKSPSFRTFSEMENNTCDTSVKLSRQKNDGVICIVMKSKIRKGGDKKK